MFDTFSGSFPVNAVPMPLHHVPSSPSPKVHGFRHLYDLKHNLNTLRGILHKPDLQYGVSDGYRLATNSVGLAREHN